MRILFQWFCALTIVLANGNMLWASDSPSADQTEKGRAYFDFGVFAYEEGDYSDAENNLKIALEFNSGNPFYNHYLGKTYIQMKQYPDAEIYLQKALSIQPDMTGLKFDYGYLKFKTEEYREASVLLREVADAEPENVLAHYYAGISLFKQELHAHAVDYFVHAAEKSPTIRANSHYYAGVCFQKIDEISNAIRMFESVRDDPESGVLQESAERWIDVLKQREKTRKPYRVFAKLGVVYDDNVKLKPDDEATSISDESDWAALFYANGTYDIFSRNRFKAGVGYSHYQTIYKDLDEYNLTGSIGQIYGAYTLYPFTFQLTYYPIYYWADGDSYLRQHRFEPEMIWRANKNILARLLLRYSDNKYFEDENRSGHTGEVFADAFYSILDGRGKVFAGLGYADNSAAHSDQYYTQWRLKAGAAFKFPWEVNFGLGFDYRARDYDNVNSVYNTERNDDKYTFSMSASRPVIYDWLKVMGEYKYVANDSNIDIYEYTRNVFTLSMTANF